MSGALIGSLLGTNAGDLRVTEGPMAFPETATSATKDPSRRLLKHDYWGGHFIIDLSLGRLVTNSVEQAVSILDGWEYVDFGSSDNLHFHHILFYFNRVTSCTVENVQKMCARHNLIKSAKII